jgi:hypothetical protein
MRNRAIVSCCFSPHDHGRYATYADRLERSLDEFGPDADRVIWRKDWPTGSPTHQESNYAFKYYAVKDAFDKGYRYVLWLDAGVQAVAPIAPIWERAVSSGYALLRGGDPLWKWISDYALEHFGYRRDDIRGLGLFGGCMIGLDRESAVAMEFFRRWGEIVKDKRLMMGAHRIQSNVGNTMRSILLSDADLSPISTDATVEGHRSDEACFSLVADKLGMQPMTYTEWEKLCRTY